jgi:beta-lactam-binding protein with PASTA domain
MTDTTTTPSRARRRTLRPVPLWAWALIGLVVAALGTGAAYLASGALTNVPDVVGRPSDEAQRVLGAAGFSPSLVTKVETSAPAGQVLAQDPAPGTIARRGDAVRLTVATPLPVPAPDVVGRSAEYARAALTGSGLAASVLESYDASATSGTVIAQAPIARSVLVKGAVVALLVSKGPVPALVTVPNVSGRTELDASAVLTLAGFETDVLDSAGSTAASGTVAGQLPRAGAKGARGSTVYVLVSRGDSSTAVALPDVSDLAQTDALSALTAAGFPARVVRARSTTIATGTVIAQLPPPGARAARGSDVLVIISTGRAAGFAAPSLSGRTSAAAQAALEPLELVFRSVSSPSASVPAGIVIAQLPTPGALVVPGTSVLCVVSSGAPR